MRSPRRARKVARSSGYRFPIVPPRKAKSRRSPWQSLEVAAEVAHHAVNGEAGIQRAELFGAGLDRRRADVQRDVAA
jgi:hypothetical protein